MSFERISIIAAAVFLLVAALLLWRNNLTGAFVTATLGVVAWFLSYRSQMRAKVSIEPASEGDEDINED
jgi:hypothetical protein